MKFELKDFQNTSARAVLDELDEVDVSDPSVRKRALQMSAAGDLESLFDDSE